MRIENETLSKIDQLIEQVNGEQTVVKEGGHWHQLKAALRQALHDTIAENIREDEELRKDAASQTTDRGETAHPPQHAYTD